MNLDKIFNPKSISVIGASPTAGTVGNIMFQNFIDFGFSGEIYPVNPKHEEIAELETYPKVTDVPGEVDLVLVLVPAKDVPDIVEDCVEKGVHGIVIVSSGFSETGNVELEQKILDAIEGTETRIVGPNCMGLYCPSAGITYDSGFPREGGSVGFISQSGGIGEIFTHFAADRGIRISKLISSGNETDLKFIDYLEYLADDPDTEVIAGYVEQIRNGRRFVKVAEKITQKKPIVLWKVGKGEAGRRAAMSHTAAMAGSDEVYDGVFRQAGVIKAENVNELVDFVLLFKCLKPRRLEKLGVITGPGGLGVSIIDALEGEGFEVPQFSKDVRMRLRNSLPSYAQVLNPVDLTFAIAEDPSMVGNSVEILMDEEEIDGIVIGNMLVPSRDSMLGGLDEVKKPILLTSPFYFANKDEVYSLAQTGIPAYPTPEGLAKSLDVLRSYVKFLKQK